jgi:NPCBM/NEW2 domain
MGASMMKNKDEISELLFRLLDNEISDDDFLKLKNHFSSDPEAKQYYCQFMADYSLLTLRATTTVGEDTEESSQSDILENDIWDQLIETEKNAPAIEIPEAEKKQEEVKIIKIEKKVNKISLYAAIFSSAAAFLMITYVYLNPQVVPYEVATVQDSINAQGSSNLPIISGSRISTDPEPIQLSKGVVKFVTDDNVEVLLQGPAEFVFVSSSEIKLNYGKLFARVSDQGLGFAVATPNSKIVDLGTEFGVLSHINGDTEVHMYKGKANLFAGSKLANKTSQLITSGFARKVLHTSSNVKEILLEEKAVVRNIDSKAGMIWNGQSISLADIVGGGNGFSGGVLYKGVDVFTGDVITELLSNDTLGGSKGYITVSDNRYIDGVFVPGIDGDMTQIISERSQSVQFPKTSGSLWGYIFNGAIHEGTTTSRHSLQLDGTVFGTNENPAIAIHSNQGITFDLSKIRRDVPGLRINEFSSLVGVSETVASSLEKENSRSFDDLPEIKKIFDVKNSKVEFWVFLDGRQVFHKEVSSAAGAELLQVPITRRDRFLTLAVTESDDTAAYDWALFGRPELIVDYE